MAVNLIIIIISIILTLQGVLTLIWMLYAWEDPSYAERHKSPKTFENPNLTFTALLPARHEETVISDTIRAINKINYPDSHKQLLVLIRQDDQQTLKKALETIRALGKDNIKLITFEDYPINKPRSLNNGLLHARGEVVAVFDAEDEPHPDIYNIVNTTMIRQNVDVVQSGIQLMNFRDKWFSTLNVMEYFFWFKSGLHFFSRIGRAAPLGGNTVFFKRIYLQAVSGWDEECLTEDADIGIRLANIGAKLRVVYDETHTTREETPSSTFSFIKQRTRWNQGFLQIFVKGDWLRLPGNRQKLIILYIFLWPILQALLITYLPLGLAIALATKPPIIVSIISFLPAYLFVAQVFSIIIGMREFTKAYGLAYPFWMPLKIIVTIYPYHLVLLFSAFRAIYRFVFNRNTWEKTLHINAHRTSLATQYENN